MTGTVLERRIYSVINRLLKLRILRRQTACWLLLLVPAMLITLWLPPQIGRLGPEIPVVLATTLLGILLARIFVKNPSKTEAARLIEQADPELNDAVLTAIQVADRPGPRPSVLAAMAIQEANKLAVQRDWSGAVPARQIMKWTVLSFVSFVVMVSSVMAASRYGRDLMRPSPVVIEQEEAKSNSTPLTELAIEPGNTEIELGSALTVVARFPSVVPTRAVLEFTDANKATRQLSMSETVDSGVFAARMEEIIADGTYRVLYEETQSKSDKPLSSPAFNVKTYVRPKLEHVDAVITPPAWAGRPQETIEDVMRITVTEGSTVNLQLYLNKPVAFAELQPRDGEPVILVPSAQDPAMVETTLVVSESNVWAVSLKDADGRTPHDEEKISVKVTFNEPAKIKVTFPGRDTNVSPLQEFLVEAKASDDFELVDFGVQYSLSGGELKESSLKKIESNEPAASSTVEPIPVETAAAAESSSVTPPAPMLSAELSYHIELEPLDAEPDDLVTYSFWASDIAADGTERRSYSDIMFAEVRRFEEIFRESQQGNQPPQPQQQQQQQQQQGSAVDGVLKLQKEIISATWNTIRTESTSRRNGSFTQDVETIAESQGEAIQQVEQAMQELTGDPKAMELSELAIEQMKSARQTLEDVRDAKENSKLSAAMPVEQSIVQTLLRMRAAEFEVRQQQQQQGGGGGGGGSSASEQQLQQLELDNNRNRYESEQQAQQQQEMTQQQREQVQVLNRLKELARRQQMVNERLKQLESELRAATSQKEREEIERELKRLRDEQREMLRDVDELSERMEQATSQDNPQKSEMKQQMDQARENVQQASRAMDEGRLSEAISEGTRAERQFEELKDDFRNQTSSQFDETVRDLRDQARELTQRQQELARQLAGESPDGEKNKKPSLKSERNREELQKGFAEQQDRLNRIVEQAKQTIEQAEQTEPLLSNKLYDTLRDLKDSKPEEALEATEFLTGRGMWAQSQEAEQAARRGIEQLQKGIEKAADSVLGSESESLRRAQTQLEEATRKLVGEVKSATGEDPTNQRRPGQRGQQNQDGETGANGDTSANSETGANGEASERDPNGQPADSEDTEPQPTRRPGQRGQQTGERQSDNDQKSSGSRGSPSASERAAAGRPGEQSEPGEQENSEQSESQSGDPAQENDDSQQKASSDQKGQKGQKGQGGRNSQNGQKGESQAQDGQPQDTQSEQSGNGEGGKGQSGGSQGGGQSSSGEQSQSDQNQASQDQRGKDQQAQNQQGQQQGQRRPSSLMSGGREGNGGGNALNSARPLTGDDFSEWSDQLRDIEEMLEDPELRNRVAQVRDRARAMRAEFKRHGEMPQWDLVKSQLLGEMQSLQQRIDQEVSKLDSDRAMVPIDREPVPEEFDSLVQRYYELLGQERDNSSSKTR